MGTMLFTTIDAPALKAMFASDDRFEEPPYPRERAGAVLPAAVAEAVQGLSSTQDQALLLLAQSRSVDQFHAERELLLPRYKQVREALQAIWRAAVDPSRRGPDGHTSVAALRRAVAERGQEFYGHALVEEIDLQLATAQRAFKLVPLVNQTPLTSQEHHARDHELKQAFYALSIWTEFHFDLLWLALVHSEFDYRADVVAEILGATRGAELMYACIREAAELRGFFQDSTADSEFERTGDDEELLSHAWYLDDDDPTVAG